MPTFGILIEDTSSILLALENRNRYSVEFVIVFYIENFIKKCLLLLVINIEDLRETPSRKVLVDYLNL